MCLTGRGPLGAARSRARCGAAFEPPGPRWVGWRRRRSTSGTPGAPLSASTCSARVQLAGSAGQSDLAVRKCRGCPPRRSLAAGALVRTCVGASSDSPAAVWARRRSSCEHWAACVTLTPWEGGVGLVATPSCRRHPSNRMRRPEWPLQSSRVAKMPCGARLSPPTLGHANVERGAPGLTVPRQRHTEAGPRSVCWPDSRRRFQRKATLGRGESSTASRVAAPPPAARVLQRAENPSHRTQDEGEIGRGCATGETAARRSLVAPPVKFNLLAWKAFAPTTTPASTLPLPLARGVGQ